MYVVVDGSVVYVAAATASATADAAAGAAAAASYLIQSVETTYAT